MGEAPGVQKQKFLPIIRTDAGGFFGFGEHNLPGADEMKGRFAHLLPNKAPSAEHRALAQAMLKVQGGNPDQYGATPRLPRSRQ
jgi:hypothetical protein